jgi:hypothetical protein
VLVRAAPAIVVSAMAHVAVLAWLVSDDDATPEPHVTLPPPPPTPSDASEPIEVVMLAPPPAPMAVVSRRGAGIGGAAYTPAAGDDVSAAPAAGPIATATTGTSGLFRMRGNETIRAELRVDPHSREEIREHAHAPRSDETGDHITGTGPEGPLLDPRALQFERFSTNPYPKQEGGGFSTELQPTPGGGARIDDRVTTLTMEPDGNVKLDDKPDIDVKLKLPIPNLDIEGIRRDAGKLLTDWYRDPYANTRFGPKSEVARHLTAVPGACDGWGDTMCADPLAPGQEKYAREQKSTGGSLLGGTMDITAWLHRKFVGDPYSSRKLKLLDGTRDARIAHGGAYRTEQLERSAELMTRTLEELWRWTTDPTVRKQALFELWDDCEEGTGPRGDAGARARAIVIGWIRARLPAGSPEAYTPEEIEAFTARRASKEPFTPY